MLYRSALHHRPQRCAGDEVVVLRFSTMFRLFRRCSVVPVVFCCSGVVPSFWWCSVVPALFRRSAGVPCSGGVPLFRRSAGVLRSVVPCPGVPGFIVCRVLGRSVNFNITKISIKTARISALSVSCDYGSIMSTIFSSIIMCLI